MALAKIVSVAATEILPGFATVEQIHVATISFNDALNLSTFYQLMNEISAN